MIHRFVIFNFSKIFNHRQKTTRAAVFSCKPFPNIFKYRDHRCNYPPIGKRILCSLRLVLEELSANNFSLSNAEGKISGLLNRRSIVDLVDLDLSNDHKDCPNLHKNSWAVRWKGHPLSLKKSQWKLRHRQNFKMEGNTCRTKTSVGRKNWIQKSRTATATVRVRNPSWKFNHLDKVVWDRTFKSPKTNTLAHGLIERTSSMLDKIASKTEHKTKTVIIIEKRSKTPNE